MASLANGRNRRRGGGKRSGRTGRKLLHLLSLAVILLVGCMIVVTKVKAQPAAPRAMGVKEASPSVSASPVAAKGTAPAPSSSAAPVVDGGAALPPPGDGGAIEYAEVQTEADFDPSLTEEQKSAIGTGKVPIHREGKFRSPFAHPRFGGPATAKVGLVIDEIRDYNIQNGTFEAEFFVSLTSDKDMPAVSLTFTNGHEVTETVLADTPTFKFYRYSGKFTSEVDLRQYPFDTQQLTIAIEDKAAGIDQLILEADPARTSLNSEFRLAGYGVAAIAAKAYKHLYPPRFDRDDLYISRYKFTLSVDRFAQSAAFSVFVPAFIIVLISLMGMWVPPEELEVRSNAGAPMLAAAVLFHYSLIQALPATGYLTRADLLMLGVYVSLLMNMGSTWFLLIVDEENLDVWFKRFRTLVPILTFFVMVAASIA